MHDMYHQEREAIGQWDQHISWLHQKPQQEMVDKVCMVSIASTLQGPIILIPFATTAAPRPQPQGASPKKSTQTENLLIHLNFL